MSTLTTERAAFEAALRTLLAGVDTGAGSGTGLGTISPTRQTVVDYVKAKLDELVPTGEGVSISLSSAPNVTDPLDLLIDAHLDECTKDVCLTAPLSVLVPTDPGITTGTPYTDPTIGYISLPSNFLRLSSFRMADWLREVDKVITPKDPEYKKQSTQLRGGIAKPVAVMRWKNTATITGALVSLTMANGGTGYPPGTNILFVNDSHGSAGLISVTANSSGVVQTIDSIVNSGSGYVTRTGCTTYGTAGTGCTVNITVVSSTTASITRILEYY